MVNINIEIPDELHRQLKIASVLQGTTLKDYIIAAVDKQVPEESAAVMAKGVKVAKPAKGAKKANQAMRRRT